MTTYTERTADEAFAAVFPALAKWGDADDWTRDGGDLVRAGEDADGVPSWRLSYSVCGWHVTRAIGWYEQQGDADADEDVPRLMRAMDAADEALSEALWPGDREAE